MLIGPAERYDLALVADNPGVWMVHCHIEHHMANGMMTTIWYEGYQPTGPAADAAVAEATMAAMPNQMQPDTASPTPTEPVAAPAAGAGRYGHVRDRDGR